MKISTFYYNIVRACEETGKSLEEILVIFKSEGLEAVEFNCLDATDERLDILDKAGIGVSSLYRSMTLGEGGDIEKGIQLVDRAAEIGCKLAMVVPGTYPVNAEMDIVRNNILKGLDCIASYGVSKKVTVTIEDFDCDRTTLGTAEDMHHYGDKIDSLYYTFDTGNFTDLDNLPASFEMLKKKIVHVHCKDYTREPVYTGKAHTNSGGAVLYGAPFGSGMLPAADILHWLKEIGYNGFLNLEQTNADSHYKSVLQAIRWLRAHL